MAGSLANTISSLTNMTSEGARPNLVLARSFGLRFHEVERFVW